MTKRSNLSQNIFDLPIKRVKRHKKTPPLSISQQLKEKMTSPIIEIQLGTGNQHFIGFHTVSGSAICYVELAYIMGSDITFYGVQAPGLDGDGDLYIEFDKIVARYLEELYKRIPNGPYYLGGYSYGGYLALEIARSLKKDGKEVALLVMFDTFPPNNNKSDIFDSSKYLIWRFRNDMPFSEIELSQLSLDERVKYVLNKLGRCGKLPAHFDLPGLLPERLLKLEICNYQALYGYNLKVYHGDITLFRAEEESRTKDDDYGWEQFCTGRINIVDVPGDHFKLMYSPNVEVVAKKLKTCINSACLINVKAKAR